ncbi:MAG: hypothetical protein ACKO7V_12055, partial [Bacteroidota bacterium]
LPRPGIQALIGGGYPEEFRRGLIPGPSIRIHHISTTDYSKAQAYPPYNSRNDSEIHLYNKV